MIIWQKDNTEIRYTAEGLGFSFWKDKKLEFYIGKEVFKILAEKIIYPELKNTLRKRNMQIKALKKEIEKLEIYTVYQGKF